MTNNPTNKPITKSHSKWILCTKWVYEITKTKTRSFWTPFGTKDKLLLFYNTGDEARKALKEMVNLFPNLTKRNVCALHVKYVPNKIKMLHQRWFDKYVIKEVMYTVTQNSNKQEILDDSTN